MKSRSWAGKHIRFTHDAANRLTASQRSATAHRRYGFDPAGNRVAPSPLTTDEKMNCFYQISFGLIPLGAMGFVSAEELVTPPPMLRAGNVAYQDFIQRLPENSNNSAYVRHLGNIENYEIKIKKNKNGYTVTFTPIKHPTEMFFGGGAEYNINEDFNVSRVLLYK
jgi:hypothetical protein